GFPRGRIEHMDAGAGLLKLCDDFPQVREVANLRFALKQPATPAPYLVGHILLTDTNDDVKRTAEAANALKHRAQPGAGARRHKQDAGADPAGSTALEKRGQSLSSVGPCVDRPGYLFQCFGRGLCQTLRSIGAE